MNNAVDFFSDLDANQVQTQPEPSSTAYENDFFSDLDQPEPKRAFPFLPGGKERKQEGPETEPLRLAAQVAGLGSKFVKYPLEALKQFGTAEALQELHDLEMRGIPVDREKYLKSLMEHAEAFPSQEKIEKFIEEKTGLPLEPKSPTEKKAREILEFASLSPEKLLGKLGFGATSSAIKTYLVENDIPEPVADIIALGMAHKVAPSKGKTVVTEKKPDAIPGEIKGDGTPPDFPPGIPPIEPELQFPKPQGPTKETQIGKKYKLRGFAGTEIIEPRGPTPVVSRVKSKKILREINRDAQNVSNAIVKQNIPAARARASGLNLEEAYKDYYKTADKLLLSSEKKVKYDSVIKWIDKEIASIEQSIPSPSSPSEKRLSILREERKKFMKNNPEYKGVSNILLDQFGNKLPVKNVPQKVSIELDPIKVKNQFQAYNENVDSLYRKSQMTGLEEAEAKAYFDLNKKQVEALRKSGHTEAADAFEQANEIFSQTMNLDLVENILEDAFKTPGGLKKVLKGNKRNHLEKALGESAVKQLDEIAYYQTAVYDKLKEFTKTKEFDAGSFASVKKLFKLIQETPGRIAGLGYTSKNTANKYIWFQKKFLGKDYVAAEKAANDLVKELNKEKPTKELFLE